MPAPPTTSPARSAALLPLGAAALALLGACAGGAASAPAAPPVEVSLAPPPPPAAAAAPPPSSSATAAVAVSPPPASALPEAPPPEGSPDVTLDPAPSGAFSGAAGNAPGGITGIWGVGPYVFASGPGMILRSEDGGLHFTRTTGPGDWASVWGASEDDVYVAGDGAVRSTDRGKTWSRVGRLPGYAYGLWGSGPDDVYVVGGGNHPFVARSTDHGATWVELPTPISSGWLYGVTGTGPREILVVGKGRVDAPGARQDLPPTAAVFLRSTDSGRHWSRIPPFKPGTTEFEESRGACFTRKGLFAASSYALYFTPDLGRTWKEATPVGAEVLALACRGDDVIVGGRNRKLFLSRDGGKTWTSDPLGGLWTAPSLSSVQAAFVGEKGEVFVGFEGLYDKSRRGSLFRRSP